MGVCTFLVSDESRIYFDLDRLFFDENAVACMKVDGAPGGNLEGEISAWLQCDEYNRTLPNAEADAQATVIAAWMRAHPDWRFLSDQDEEFDDVYLAEDEADAKEYLAEFGGDDPSPIYKKDG